MRKSIIPSGNRSFRRGTLIDFLVLTCVWAAAVLLVNPLGDFPLNDDWSYGMTVERFIEEKTFHPPGWPGMSLISQTLWGVIVSAAFGFSFQTLHLSTLFLSPVLLFCVYLVIREFSNRRWHAMVVGLTLAFNPMFFSLSHTFMTEIPFMVFITLSFLFFIRTLKSDSILYLVFGAVLSTVAILCRQIGFFIPISFGLVYLLKKKVTVRSLFWAGLPLAVGLGVLTGFQKWMEATGKLPESYNSVIKDLLDILFHHPQSLIYTVPRNTFFTVQYLGLFLLPVLLLLFPIQSGKKRTNRIVMGIMLLYFIASMSSSFLFGHPMPLFTKFESILIREGLGPITLHDTFIRHLANLPALPDVFWMIVTLFSIVGGGLLLASLASTLIRLASDVRSIRKENPRLHEIFFLLSAVIYFFPLAVSRIYFDRYLLPLFLPLAFFAIQARTERFVSKRRIVGGISALLIGCSAFFSILMTHDYMAWNRTRWEALRHLMNEEGIPPSQIDGGFEFNGLYLYRDEHQIQNVAPDKSWWWVQDDLYMITFGEVPGYEKIQRYRYDRWFPRSEGQILVLRREESPPTL